MDLALLTGHLPAFGADAILAPADDLTAWHHRRLTQEAAREAGWSAPAATELGRFADGIDRILFNPIWIAAGGPRRIWGAHMARAANHLLHFDDLPSDDLVSSAWERYVGGAKVALRWAATLPEGDAIRVVRCAVGLLMHAVEDFYSHSTWIDDPLRRETTWWRRPTEPRCPPPPTRYRWNPATAHLGYAAHGARSRPGYRCGAGSHYRPGSEA